MHSECGCTIVTLDNKFCLHNVQFLPNRGGKGLRPNDACSETDCSRNCIENMATAPTTVSRSPSTASSHQSASSPPPPTFTWTSRNGQPSIEDDDGLVFTKNPMSAAMLPKLVPAPLLVVLSVEYLRS